MFYHTGNSRHTQNIQINKVIGENENHVLFYGKNKRTFWPTQYYFVLIKVFFVHFSWINEFQHTKSNRQFHFLFFFHIFKIVIR